MFKTASLFNILTNNSKLALDVPLLESAAQTNIFIPCEPSQERSVGWAPARNEEHGALVESVAGHLFMRLMIETRAVPSRAINDMTAERCKQIELSTGRKPGKKETRDYKDEARLTLLPHAFPARTSVLVWIDPTANRIVIDAAVQSRIDEVVTQLVRLTEGLTITHINTNKSPASVMSTWLHDEDQISHSFEIGRSCTLKAADESKAQVRYKNHDLSGDEVKEHISRGKFASTLELVYNSRVSFTLTEAGTLTNLDILDVVFEDKADKAADMFDANAAIFTGEMTKLLPDLIAALGDTIPTPD